MSKPNLKAEAMEAHKQGARWDGSEWVFPNGSDKKASKKKEMAKKLSGLHKNQMNVIMNAIRKPSKRKNYGPSLKDQRDSDMEATQNHYWHEQQERNREYGD